MPKARFFRMRVELRSSGTVPFKQRLSHAVPFGQRLSHAVPFGLLHIHELL